MNASIASQPASSPPKKLVLWPLWGILIGCAIGIVSKNPALGLSVALFGGTVCVPLNARMEGRRAKVFIIIAFIATISAIVLAAMGNSTLVWFLIGVALVYDIYLSRRR